MKVFCFLYFYALWAATLLCNLNLLQKRDMFSWHNLYQNVGKHPLLLLQSQRAKGRFLLSWLLSEKPKLAYYPWGGTSVQILVLPVCGILGANSQKKELQPGERWAVSREREKEKCSLPRKQRDFQLLTLKSDAKSSSGSCQQSVEWV